MARRVVPAAVVREARYFGAALAFASRRLVPAVAHTRSGRWLAAVSHAPVPRKVVLAATALTAAAAVGGGSVYAAGAGSAPGSVQRAEAAVPAGGPAAPAPVNGAAPSVPGPASPSRDRLIPHGTEGEQVSTSLSVEQRDNARAIVDSAKRTGVGERGAVIGVATSLQESKLNNFGHLGAFNDHDSLGLFQQRPSSGWGRPDQLTDPDYAASAFFNGLKQVNGWQDMPLTDAAQSVQVSAYPFAYAQWESQAADLVQQLWDR